MTWVLTDGTVMNRDQIKTEGKITTGYVVEATATAKGPARVSRRQVHHQVYNRRKGRRISAAGRLGHNQGRGGEDGPPQPRLHQRDPSGESGLQPRSGRGWGHQRPMFSSVPSGAMAARNQGRREPSRGMKNLMALSPSDNAPNRDFTGHRGSSGVRVADVTHQFRTLSHKLYKGGEYEGP